MTLSRVLIANRGEIAVRIARAVGGIGMTAVAVYADDDEASLHARIADEAYALKGAGPAAYLDVEGLISVARTTGCDAVHPGYGFLSESAAFARRAQEAGIFFVGPQPEVLDLFGDKAKARALAARCGLPILAGTEGAASLAEVQAFMRSLGPKGAVMLKAVAGGGGRGMRAVTSPDELESAYERCSSEARTAFGSGEIYAERYLPKARHIEVQIIGDGRTVSHLGERECSIQRRNQKIMEVAPSPTLGEALRRKLCAEAVRLGREIGYSGLGTVEFLVPEASGEEFVFIEVNPRLQVEHTVTEAVLGVDLVKSGLRIAAGASLAELGLAQDEIPPPRGHAIQLRINLEAPQPDGTVRPSGGVLQAFDPPSGPGIRVDTFAYAGYRTSPRYDSLLAKLIVHAPEGDYPAAVRQAHRALREFRITGLSTNTPLLLNLLCHPDVVANQVHTRFLEEHSAELLTPSASRHRPLFFEPAPSVAYQKARRSDPLDPLALFDQPSDPGRSQAAADPRVAGPDGAAPVLAPLQGTIVALLVTEGDVVRRGEQVAVIEAMKMEHLVTTATGGRVRRIEVEVGDAVFEQHPLMVLAPQEIEDGAVSTEEAPDLDAIRPDLAEVMERHALLTDERRPEAVARRRRTGQRTARENVADLVDPDSFIEYGGLALAAQRHRRTVDELLRMSPADGLVTGIGSVNGALFPEQASRCAVMAYDYTVFAGTQGVVNHRKKDRLLELASRWTIPVVIFAEGGGGRPGDDWPTPAGLDTTTFTRLGALSGKVPTVGIVSGRCFAGNAALLGSCDVIIAAQDSNIGMGGPAMVEGGGLGVFRPEDIGPMDVQVPNGVVDLPVADEAEGVRAAKRYLSYFQGRVADWESDDQRLLRRAIPENRLRAYDIRALISVLADRHSVLELRPGFGVGMITAFVRIEGRPLGLIANNSRHLGGAIDADGADKAARFIQLCDAHAIPVLSLCDTPGMMVGPEVEKTAQVRHVSRLFVTASNAAVPFFTVVLRKAYGLGALAMAGGGSRASFFFVAWPTGEFGAMGLEGSVKLAYRKEMAAIADPAERKAWFDAMVAKAYDENKALSGATSLEIDDVIDPVDTRRWIVRGLSALPAGGGRHEHARNFVDVW